MKSMTGYGRYTLEADGRSLLIEVKTVNHRYLDINIKLPKAHNYVESSIRKTIQSMLSRGRVDIYVTYTDLRDTNTDIIVNTELAKSYYHASRKIVNELQLENNEIDYSLSDIMRAPNVISEIVISDDEELILKLYDECLDITLKNLIEMRTIEGEAIKLDIISKIEDIKFNLETVATRAPEVFNDYGICLKERVLEALAEVDIDESRLANEIAFYTDKYGIDEEITRLRVHINSFENMLKLDEACGRKLDFVVQEMNREANTIASKANDISLSASAIEIKSTLEKVREQIQNIE